MPLEQNFAEAQERVKTLAKRPGNAQLLELYALFKQATEGDATGKRPGMLDVVGRAKYDAWAARRGTDRSAAMQSYVELVARLGRELGFGADAR
jgi:acyl-CoA-binding protein